MWGRDGRDGRDGKRILVKGGRQEGTARTRGEGSGGFTPVVLDAAPVAARPDARPRVVVRERYTPEWEPCSHAKYVAKMSCMKGARTTMFKHIGIKLSASANVELLLVRSSSNFSNFYLSWP